MVIILIRSNNSKFWIHKIYDLLNAIFPMLTLSQRKHCWIQAYFTARSKEFTMKALPTLFTRSMHFSLVWAIGCLQPFELAALVAVWRATNKAATGELVDFNENHLVFSFAQSNQILEKGRTVLLLLLCCYSVTLRVSPWILKQGLLETYGQRLISEYSKTRRIVFFKTKKIYSFQIFF